MTTERTLLLLVICCSACVVTDVGNPQTEEVVAEVELQGFDEAMPNALTFEDGLEITHAWIAVDRVDLEPCDIEEPDGAGEDDFNSDSVQFGPVVADLIGGQTFPGALRLSKPDQQFCSFEFSIRPLEAAELPAAAPDEMVGRSLLVRGTLKDGNPFVIYGTLDDDLELEVDLELAPGETTRFVLGFALNRWVTQRQLGALTGNPIVVDATTTPSVYEAFEDAVVGSPRLFEGEVGGRTLAP